MNRSFIVLRKPEGRSTPAPGTRRGPQPRGSDRPDAAPAATPTPTIEVHTLSGRDARELARDDEITAVAPAIPMKLIAPVAAGAAGRTAAEADAGQLPWGLDAVGAPQSPYTGQGVVVAVLDTGIDASHPAFNGVELVQKNFTGEAPSDQHGHGTHCAGTIFGREVQGRRIGVAPGVGRALIGKVLGEGGGGSDQLARAMLWAVDEGAHVISMSLGIDFPGYVKEMIQRGIPEELATSIALEDYRANVAMFGHLASFLRSRASFAQPVLVVAAAGNESQRNRSADFEIAVSPPAVADGFISVAALGRKGTEYEVAYFSNTGARISGPGVGVLSAAPGGGLVEMSGTSMATPHVAGVAALWAQKLAQGHELRAERLVDQLMGSAERSKLVTGFDPTDVGAGMVRAPRD